MDQRTITSPKSNELIDDFQSLFDNDQVTGFQGPIYGPDGGIYLPSTQVEFPLGYDDAIGPNGLKVAENLYRDFAFDASHYPELYNSETPELGIRRVSRYSTPPSSSYVTNHPAETPIHEPVDLPLTPKSTASNMAKTTRSGRVIRSSTPRSISSKASKTSNSAASRTKTARKRSSNTKAPRISEPLSELTKHMTDVPLRDMDAWVHRSEEERHKEVEKKNGYVSRPMNSFMLYRSAYAERTKQWCLQNNHQVVSAVSGESWPMEPSTIREKYNELARIERDKHAKAHPDYKFSPSKGRDIKRKVEFSSEDEDEDSGQNDGDAEWKPRNRRRKIRSTIDSQIESNQVPSKARTSFNRLNELKYITVPASTWEIPGPSQRITLGTSNGGPYYHDDMSFYSQVPMSGVKSTETYPFDFSATQISSLPSGIAEAYDGEIISPGDQNSLFFNRHIDPLLSQFDNSTAFDNISYLYGDGQTYIQPSSQFEDWMESTQYTQ